jgi:hypothetical protein
MHPGAEPSHRSCTLCTCRVAGLATGAPKRSVTLNRRWHLATGGWWSCTRSATSSGSPTPAARQQKALGISRSTLRRLLPYVETIEMPWGTKLIPVDELERLTAERRRAARARLESHASGRPPAVSHEIAERIRAARTRGKSFRQIAAELNAEETPTVHGGVQWWPSTVRAVLRRAA